jgi:hypothetical protein
MSMMDQSTHVTGVTEVTDVTIPLTAHRPIQILHILEFSGLLA